MFLNEVRFGIRMDAKYCGYKWNGEIDTMRISFTNYDNEIGQSRRMKFHRINNKKKQFMAFRVPFNGEIENEFIQFGC